jgi:YbbR domain-containing protein
MPSRLFQNYRIKLVVVALAIFLWFYVVTEERYEYALDIPVVVVNLREDRVIRNEIPERAEVLFEGTGKALLAMMLNPDARLVLDLSKIRYRYTFRLDPKRVQLDRRDPELVAVKVLQPDTITVLLAEKHRRRLPVNPDVTIHPANGYMVVGDVLVTPDSAWATGPRDLIDTLSAIRTTPVRLKEARGDVKRRVRLLPPGGRMVSIYPERAEIFVDVQKLTETKITGIPVEIRNHPRNLHVESVPSTLSLTLEGGVDLLLQLKKEDIVAYVDFRHWNGDLDGELPAYIETPPGIRYRDVRPARFRLLVEKGASE